MKKRPLRACLLLTLAMSSTLALSCSSEEPKRKEHVTPEQKKILEQMGDSYKK